MTTSFEPFDWHGQLVQDSLLGKSESRGVPGELQDYFKLSGQSGCTPVEAFDIFVKRWIDQRWWPHLMDNDDNEAEFVRRHIRGEVEADESQTGEGRPEKFKIWYIHQVGNQPVFEQEVDDPEEGQRILDTIYDLMLKMQAGNYIPDYANTGGVSYFDEEEQEWLDYDPEDWQQ